jgi:flavin-dependent dehydrogenase
MRLTVLAKALLFAFAGLCQAATFDLVVYGGTPGGVASAVAAARQGRTVALIEYHRHIGGMTTSGLGKSDIETREAIGGLFREFTGKVYAHYVERYGAQSENVKLSRQGYYYEPSVAQRVLDRMVLDESKIRLFTYHRLEEVIRQGSRVTGIRVRDRAAGTTAEFRARIFIDASYEGDLAAYAGARYRIGREARAEHDELHAGVRRPAVFRRQRLLSRLLGPRRRAHRHRNRVTVVEDRHRC